ncbi:MAG: uroporphyrinogen-III synthase [Alphaproteobacteria bacterium]|nr:uroporphyrinogen-III synthase [Alphaproteobacteria bacterium]
MRILVTRPREDAEPFARALVSLGHETVIEPLLDVVFLEGPQINLTGVQAILLTSANGARALARRTQTRDIKIVAVGRATGDAARSAGFVNVIESTGEGVDALADLVRAKLRPEDGALIHPTGSVAAGDLAAALGVRGFKVRREVIYDARAVYHLSGAVVAELSSGLIDAATFFSPRTAALFVELIDEENLESALASVTAICLSQAVASALAPARFAAIKIAEKPSQDAMLAVISAR